MFCLCYKRVCSFQKLVGVRNRIFVVLRVIRTSGYVQVRSFISDFPFALIRLCGLVGLGSSFTFGLLDTFSAFGFDIPWTWCFGRRLSRGHPFRLGLLGIVLRLGDWERRGLF